MEMMINMEIVTVQDCIENWKLKGNAAVINDGRVLYFEHENSAEE